MVIFLVDEEATIAGANDGAATFSADDEAAVFGSDAKFCLQS